MNRWDIREAEKNCRRGLDYLGRMVEEFLPIGSRVEYLHGDHWIGPCEVTGYGRAHREFGPEIRVTNLKTGKTRKVCSYDYVRHVGDRFPGRYGQSEGDES